MVAKIKITEWTSSRISLNVLKYFFYHNTTNRFFFSDILDKIRLRVSVVFFLFSDEYLFTLSTVNIQIKDRIYDIKNTISCVFRFRILLTSHYFCIVIKSSTGPESEENMNDILKLHFKISFIFSSDSENMNDILKLHFKISFIFSSDSDKKIHCSFCLSF